MANNIIQKTDTLEGIKNLKVLPGEDLRLELAYFDVAPDGVLNIHVGNESNLNVYVSDFSIGSNKLELNVELEEGASCEIRMAVLSHDNGKKLFAPNVVHLSPRSEAYVSCYGIAADQSDLSFKGLSTIVQGAKKSNTRQDAKIILFDKDTRGSASPSLKIGENDVKAGHGASIGRLSDEHLFYLESRGLSEKEAKRLIILGYLKPITRYYSDESLKQRIDETIERGIHHD